MIVGLDEVVAIGFVFELLGLRLRRKKAPSWAGRQRSYGRGLLEPLFFGLKDFQEGYCRKPKGKSENFKVWGS